MFTYDNGRQFWIDLLNQYGLEEARRMAKEYLKLPIAGDAKGRREEIQFREELEEAMCDIEC